MSLTERIENASDVDVMKLYLTLQTINNYCKLDSGGADGDTSIVDSTGNQLSEQLRRSKEIENDVVKNLEEINKLTRELEEDIDEDKLKAAECFFEKKRKLKELENDPLYKKLMGGGMGESCEEYNRYLNEIKLAKEELEKEESLGLHLKRDIDALKEALDVDN
ncbi:unnamed protein product [Anisakis simplex]|uniref:THO complex subunit 7 n=1 Tax=Anisakis simplex TaxID=6269 RepID=A0A0M3J3P7_ANISI|nr:unnamed protein product [Anisakis simplex]